MILSGTLLSKFVNTDREKYISAQISIISHFYERNNVFICSNLKKQLTPVERYALTVIERNEEAHRIEILRQAEAEIEAQKQDFDMKKIDTLTAEVTEAGTSFTKEQTPPDNSNNSDAVINRVKRTRSQVEVPIDLWKLDTNSALRNSQGHYW